MVYPQSCPWGRLRAGHLFLSPDLPNAVPCGSHSDGKHPPSTPASPGASAPPVDLVHLSNTPCQIFLEL